ncbi:hypothetical protein [Photobacterium gaetbulicola]|uniref:hypothetical protein n=1 Tax=Photobacterium gaetbulicola TaxID=1295392 RepID=UPI000A9BE7EA|nr:hypothetical protein [Photobacterium gaetbulicola]
MIKTVEVYFNFAVPCGVTVGNSAISLPNLLLSPYQAYTRRKLAVVFHAFGKVEPRIDLQPLLLDHFSDLSSP